jgi:hypothetical protein
MWTVIFWKKAGERMIRAFAASFLSLIGMDATNIISSGTLGKIYAALGASIFSLLISVGASTVGDPSDPSLLEKQ